jgi:hypothetical protein
MTALTKEADRAVTGGVLRRLPLAASANPFAGSLLSLNTAGYATELVTGRPFAGICRSTIPSANAPVSAGDVEVEAIAGEFQITVAITGAAAVDALKRRKVYASDDNAFSFSPIGTTYIGRASGYDAQADKLIVSCQTADLVGTGGACPLGTEVLADEAQTLTVSQLDKLLVISPGAGRTLTLPPAADCAGRCFTVKTLAAQVITLDADAAETIDGAATNVLVDAANDVLTILSDGAKWLSISGKIA